MSPQLGESFVFLKNKKSPTNRIGFRFSRFGYNVFSRARVNQLFELIYFPIKRSDVLWLSEIARIIRNDVRNGNVHGILRLKNGSFSAVYHCIATKSEGHRTLPIKQPYVTSIYIVVSKLSVVLLTAYLRLKASTVTHRLALYTLDSTPDYSARIVYLITCRRKCH